MFIYQFLAYGIVYSLIALMTKPVYYFYIWRATEFTFFPKDLTLTIGTNQPTIILLLPHPHFLT